MSYSDCNGVRWDTSLEMLEPLASWKQLMVGPGNHEIEYMANTEMAFQGYEYRWFMPDAGAPTGMHGGAHFAEDDTNTSPDCMPSEFRSNYNFGNSFYSFENGPLHFISLNCYSQSDPDSEQYKWLVNDFAKVDRSKTPFIVIMGHCPYYNTNSHHYMEWQTLDQQSYFEPLFMENSVNLVIAGHVHAYQRSHPVYNGEVVEDGPVYIVVGDGGNREGHAKKYVKPDPEWSAYKNDTSFGHGTITIFNDTHMQWEWFINDDDREWYSHDTAMMTTYNTEPVPVPVPVNPKKKHHSSSDIKVTAQVTFLIVLVLVVLGLFYVSFKAGLLGGPAAGSGDIKKDAPALNQANYDYVPPVYQPSEEEGITNGTYSALHQNDDQARSPSQQLMGDHPLNQGDGVVYAASDDGMMRLSSA
mmetsp:Transcript_20506/g.26683  ORF Transcript_20506/g.26683 Transcript_20506/m.26683 type:complete len:414 (-) Transcript_20506:210-1451(-)